MASKKESKTAREKRQREAAQRERHVTARNIAPLSAGEELNPDADDKKGKSK